MVIIVLSYELWEASNQELLERYTKNWLLSLKKQILYVLNWFDDS